MTEVAIHQIVYSPETAALADPGFARLDNFANPRPDWWEYWPIRRFLLETPLRDDVFYGFLSPRFGEKTGLAAQQVHQFVRESAPHADVVTFSPQFDMGAFFLNLYEQNELFDPGFSACAQQFFDTVPDLLAGADGRPIDVAGLLMDSRQVVVSNYFAARPAFWQAWLAINERLFAICEGSDSPLRRQLTAPTTYKGGAARKIFLSERIASTLLACQPHWRVRAWNPIGLAWSASRLNQFPHEAVLSDALKIAARETGHPQFLAAFARVRQVLRTDPGGDTHPPPRTDPGGGPRQPA
ncbi:MAG TPA: hypothetical protein PKA20_14145 [Burkholderiaceae bacterium]|nr:hypothetical protein [Burkholderiaceae bacterium]